MIKSIRRFGVVLDNGVMTTSKRRILSFVLTVKCNSESEILKVKVKCNSERDGCQNTRHASGMCLTVVIMLFIRSCCHPCKMCMVLD